MWRSARLVSFRSSPSWWDMFQVNSDEAMARRAMPLVWGFMERSGRCDWMVFCEGESTQPVAGDGPQPAPIHGWHYAMFGTVAMVGADAIVGNSPWPAPIRTDAWLALLPGGTLIHGWRVCHGLRDPWPAPVHGWRRCHG